MQVNDKEKMTPQSLLDTFILFSVIVFLVLLCARVFSPFSMIMLWAVMLAIMLYPLHQKLAGKLKGKQGLAAALIVLVGFLLIGGPSVMLAGSVAKNFQKLHNAIESNEPIFKKPGDKVEALPVIGPKLYKAWDEAATNWPKFIKDYKPQLKTVSLRALSVVENSVKSVMVILGALAIAGVMMTWGATGTNAMRNVYSRIAGPDNGPHLQTLSVMTVRSVATGVLGVAFIQALLLGVGFFLAGVPAAGVLALIVMMLGILQLPATLISLPVIIYLWAVGDASVVMNIVFTVYLVVAGLADNVLKPLLLGRGVDAPMPVILLGALGGMITGGFIGMFLGSVLLAIGYQVFMDWVNTDVQPAPAEAKAIETSDDS